jgi:hypothetical protein
MLCLPGFTPVAKLAQATGDSEGWVVSSFAKVPVSDSFFRLGSLPSSMNLRASVGSMPSKPMTNTRCLARRTGLPEGRDPHACARSESAARAATSGMQRQARIARF